MAASANLSGDNNQQDGVSNGNGATTNGISVPENSVVGPTQAALRHNPGLCVEWTPEEQTLLQDLLAKWINKKENGKRRKEDHNSSRKNKDKKEKVVDPSAKSSSQLTNRSNGPPYAQTAISMDSDDGISYKAIGGATGQLLEQNAQALDQISANFGAFKIHDNINLFCQARNNILSILNDLNDLPEIMKQMPPLPVKLNEELASSILPRSSLQKKS